MPNLFADGDLLLTRLGAVTGVQTAQYGSRIIGANDNDVILPAIFLVPGESEAMAGVSGSDKAHERQQWIVGVRATMDPAASAANSAETRLGTIASAVIKAITITNTGDGLKNPVYLKRTPVQYPEARGFAEVWLTFETVAQIT